MKRIAFLLLTAGVLWGCREEDVVVCPVAAPTPAETLQAFLRRNAPLEQSFIFDLGRPQPIRTQGGATILLPPDAFELVGRGPTGGNAQLRVRELYSVGDMLLADRPTSDIRPTYLQSGGEFQFRAWQAGLLRMVPRAIDGSENVLKLLSPRPVTRDSVRRFGMSLWSLIFPPVTWTNIGAAVADSLPLVVTSVAQPLYYSRIPLDTISWWNIDQLWQANPAVSRTTAEFSFDFDGDATTYTRTWAMPTGVNALFSAYPSSTTPGGVFNKFLLFDVPVGSRLTALVLQSRADGLYWGTQAAVVQASGRSHVTLVKLSEAEILQRIRQL